MTEAQPSPESSSGSAEAFGWTGFDLDDGSGSRIGRVHSVFIDADSGEPTWLIAALGRRGAKKVALPLRDCAGAAGRVWTAHRREALREAPTVDPTRPLLREHELVICVQLGIGERVGRAAEVAPRPEGSATSRPVAG